MIESKRKCIVCTQLVGFIKIGPRTRMQVSLPARTIMDPKMGETIYLENGTKLRNPAVGMRGYDPHFSACMDAMIRKNPREEK